MRCFLCKYKYMEWPSVSRNKDETLQEYDRRRWVLRRTHQRREKTMGDAKCNFCGILMASKFVTLKSKKYCQTCRKDPGVKRHLRNLYQQRFKQKKRGETQDSLNFAEDID